MANEEHLKLLKEAIQKKDINKHGEDLPEIRNWKWSREKTCN